MGIISKDFPEARRLARLAYVGIGLTGELVFGLTCGPELAAVACGIAGHDGWMMADLFSNESHTLILILICFPQHRVAAKFLNIRLVEYVPRVALTMVSGQTDISILHNWRLQR